METSTSSKTIIMCEDGDDKFFGLSNNIEAGKPIPAMSVGITHVFGF